MGGPVGHGKTSPCNLFTPFGICLQFYSGLRRRILSDLHSFEEITERNCFVPDQRPGDEGKKQHIEQGNKNKKHSQAEGSHIAQLPDNKRDQQPPKIPEQRIPEYEP